MVVAHVVQFVALVASAWLIARAAHQSRRWMIVAGVLALLAVARLVLLGRSLDGAFEAVLASVLLVSVAAFTRLASERQRSAERMAVLGEELTRSGQRYRFLLNRLPEAFVVLEGDTIAFVNRAFARIFEIDPGAACGRQFDELIAPEWREAYHHRGSLKLSSQSGGVRRLEVEILTGAGVRTWVEMRFSTSSLENRPAEVVLIADISERRMAQRRLERFTETMLRLDGNYDANVERLTALCGELLGATSALYNRLQGEVLYTLGGWRLPTGYERIDRAKGHLCFDVITRGGDAGPLVVEWLDTTAYATSDPTVRRYGLVTYAGYPVSSRGRTVGSVCVVYDHEKKLKPADLRVLQLVASALGLEEDRRHAHEVQRAAFEIAEVAQRVEDQAALFTAVHATVARLMDAQDFSVALLDRDTQLLSFPYSSSPQEPREPRPVGRGLLEYAMRESRAVRISPEEFAGLRTSGEIVEAELGCEEWLGVPLEDRDGPFGVLVVRSHRIRTLLHCSGGRNSDVFGQPGGKGGGTPACRRARAAIRAEVPHARGSYAGWHVSPAGEAFDLLQRGAWAHGRPAGDGARGCRLSVAGRSRRP